MTLEKSQERYSDDEFSLFGSSFVTMLNILFNYFFTPNHPRTDKINTQTYHRNTCIKIFFCQWTISYRNCHRTATQKSFCVKIKKGPKMIFPHFSLEVQCGLKMVLRYGPQAAVLTTKTIPYLPCRNSH